jgi:hypothetical protein
MYYLIDFTDRTEGLYTLFEKHGDANKLIFGPDPMPRNLMIVSDPDLESYSTIVPSRFRDDYTPITLEMVQQGWSSVDAAKVTRHLILVGDMWEIGARVRKVHKGCFELSTSIGERVYVSEIGLGEPDD